MDDPNRREIIGININWQPPHEPQFRERSVIQPFQLSEDGIWRGQTKTKQLLELHPRHFSCTSASFYEGKFQAGLWCFREDKIQALEEIKTAVRKVIHLQFEQLTDALAALDKC